ncbi:acyl-CoA dehydrogenase [Polymorphobacter glacialis]|uniref:Acyl-CoA dehydrogenase n=1 Tax=Sandarakinorhabdus glacialis TaxID=1614636 RepID=A0A916ZW21_9SPHN|nr:acyl-CoA dehydrogenase family protein [Polymorphobacter glacialis]GGE14269.1 acyl-CoA dehydrogenase [Polymorphobacter glacialis]
MSAIVVTHTAPKGLDAILAELTTAFAATAAEADATGRLPAENFARLHAAGLIGLTAPTEIGGGGADLATTLKVVRAVARGEPATALILVMTYLHLNGLTRGGPLDGPRRRVAEDSVRNGALINAFRVEPELGTPARGGVPATIARRDGGRWLISGRKIFSTGVPVLSWFNVWAVTDEPTPRIGAFLVHRSAPGWRIDETWDHTGLRASASHDVIFESTPTPLDHATGLTKVGTPSTPPEASFLAWNAVLTAGIYDAIAQNARDWFVHWAANRIPANLGAPLSSLPRYQEAVGAADALLLANRALLASAVRGEISPAESSLIKYAVTENAIKLTQDLVALSGNPGLSRHNPLQRHLRDVLCGRVHTPQADAALRAAGRAAFAK